MLVGGKCTFKDNPRKNWQLRTYESRGVAGDPGDEDDLASVIGTGEWNEPP